MFSKFILEKQTKSHCPQCEQPVWLLIHKVKGTPRSPAFYICPDCVWVGEIGTGPVLSALSYCRVDRKYPDAKHATITCFICGHTSHDPNDVIELYCPVCQMYHKDRASIGANPSERSILMLTKMSKDDGEKLNQEGTCPKCGSTKFHHGPRGGHAENLMCAGCNAVYWFAPPFPPEVIPHHSGVGMREETFDLREHLTQKS